MGMFLAELREMDPTFIGLIVTTFDLHLVLLPVRSSVVILHSC